MPIQVDRQKVLKSIDQKIAHDVIRDIVLDSSSEDESETSSQPGSTEDDSSDDEAIWTVAVRTVIETSRYLSERSRAPKTKELLNIIFSSNEVTFRRNARMSRAAFESITDLIKGNPVFHNDSPFHQAHPADQLMVALGRLGFDGTASSLWTVGSRYGVGDGTVRLYTSRVIRALLSLESDVVSWPNAEEREAIKERVRDSHGFPQCIGFVDGTLVGLGLKPAQHGEGYYTRKDNYSLNAMVVCDDQRRIRHVFAGFPGSAHDHRVFTYSKLARNSSKYFTGDEYLLADSAYPISEITVPPYKKPAKNTAENSRFNRLHASARVVAEHTIGILKGRFKSLKSIRLAIKDKKDHAWAVYWIKACCVLHNLLHGDEFDEQWLVEDDGDGPRTTAEPTGNSSDKGREKREAVKRSVLRAMQYQ